MARSHCSDPRSTPGEMTLVMTGFLWPIPHMVTLNVTRHDAHVMSIGRPLSNEWTISVRRATIGDSWQICGKMIDVSAESPAVDKVEKKEKTGFWSLKSVRFQLGILLCMNFFVLAYMRHSLGMAMVCMVNSTAVGNLAGSGIWNGSLVNVTNVDACPITSQIRRDYEGQFMWTTGQQGLLFSALYMGSFISFPAGYLADRYSPKHVLSLAVAINVIGSALTPVAAEYGGYPALFVVRCIMGVGQGFLIPAVSAFISRWYPPNERATVISLYTAGNQLAGIAGMPLSALFCQAKGVLGGWPLIFFSASIFGLLSLFVWSTCVTNGPEKNNRLRPSEKAFILASTKSQDVQKGKELKRIPFKSLAMSLPVWACVVCNFADGLLTATLSSYLPTYFMEVLHLGLYVNGIFSAAPSLVQALSKFLMAGLSDKLKSSGRMSATRVSKIFNTIGCIGPAIFMIGCSFLTCHQGILAIVFLCTALGLFAGVTPGFVTSQVALAPAYAGTVSSITTAAFQLGSVVAPYIVGAITANGTRQQWQVVFATVSITLVFAGLFFLLFGSADMQEWAKAARSPCTHRQVSIPDVAVVAILTDLRADISNPDIVPASGSVGQSYSLP